MRRSLVMLIACIVGAASADAAPYVPSADSEVLEKLPTNGAALKRNQVARAMRELLAREPRNLDIALRLAQLDIDRARVEYDPRELGRAEATLAPWWNDPDAPAAVVLMRATIRQSSHQFASARADLERIVARDPSNGQAWLTLATVQQVTGDLEGAASSCERVGSTSASPIALACEAALQGLTGRAGEGYASLTRLLEHPASLGGDARVLTWLTTLKAELAERLDRPDDAAHAYTASLSIDPTDAYTIAAYADFLLDQGRPAEILPLIPADTPADILLLRRAQADAALGAEESASVRDDLASRFAALRARGDRVHLREEARFTLEIVHDPAAALPLALQNWAIQKEPLDARIALECAIAAGQPAAAKDVVAWVTSTHLEGARVAALVAEVLP
jgi:tetratricopeptide (TPR) repeat protein